MAAVLKHISPCIRRFYICGIVPSGTGSVNFMFVMCAFSFGFFSTATVGVVPEEVNQGDEL